MNSNIKLSVQEILENRNFRDAKVVAGKFGLYKTVKWVHIMEIDQIEQLLNGNELVLSTGIGWKENKEMFLSFFKQLIDSKATGLCIELGTYIPSIPEEIIELANQHNFPLIAFYNKVRFVDITQDLHTLLIKKHYQMISDLEDYSYQLNQLLLTSNPQQKILKLLHNYLKMTVLFIPNQGEAQMISKKTSKERDEILQILKGKNIERHMNIARQPIQALNQKFADLIIISESDSITEFESLILGRSATALAQNMLRVLYVEERRKTKETEWIQKWLEGSHSEERIYRYLSDFDSNLQPNGCVVLLFKVDQLDEENSEITHLKILFRSVFQSHGFFLLSTIRKNQMIFILLNKRKNSDWRPRVEAGIHDIQNQLVEDQKFAQIKFSIGKFIDQLSDIKKSYHTAQETLIIQEKMPTECFSYFYEDLYIFRLVSIADEKGALEDFISDYLGPVLIYDQQNNGKLMETLKVYLKCNGSKQETATSLYIVRQTLYQRLQKLKELLGKDFMNPYKRQAIEFAITAHEYRFASKLR
ncbi:PucR family transcriptional regulator [Bacillus pseudomycoides]|uniref:PucR family transcriptional regulator n=1 Tax=Bacillus pseudomycoides TaxID=64104 RepID=UPI001FB1B10F|nr:PucR family transcriptional regulator [Bacillus pseudomycoides]